jgi:hypothetical protein
MRAAVQVDADGPRTPENGVNSATIADLSHAPLPLL